MENPGDHVASESKRKRRRRRKSRRSRTNKKRKEDKINYIKLQSKEKEIFHISMEAACQCRTLKNMIDDSCAEGTIPLPNVSTNTLKLVIEWCEKHTDSEMENMSKEEDKLVEWETKFVDVEVDTLFDLLNAASYLHHKGLLDRLRDKAAGLIMNKTPEEIREIFGIENDYTPEEEEEVKAAFPWAFNK